MAQSVTERMECSGYPELYKDNLKAGKLIHGDYNYHNIWISSGRIAATNFEHFRMDVQVQDLYYFLRKVMENISGKKVWEERFWRCMRASVLWRTGKGISRTLPGLSGEVLEDSKSVFELQ